MDFFSEQDFALAGSVPSCVDSVHHEPIYYGIQFNYMGPLQLCIDHGTRYKVEGAYAFVTFPGAFFEYGSIEGKVRHHNFICSSGKRIQRYIDSGLLQLDHEKPLVQIRNPDKFLQLMQNITSLVTKSEVVPPRAVLLYEELLLQLYESRKNPQNSIPFQIDSLKKIIDGIRMHPEKTWDFDKTIRECNISETHFRRVFKSMTGLPPQQFLIINRLKMAANLLIHTTEPVNIIAEQCGIGNPFYFSRIFKEKNQITPLEYRREFTCFDSTKEKTSHSH